MIAREVERQTASKQYWKHSKKKTNKTARCALEDLLEQKHKNVFKMINLRKQKMCTINIHEAFEQQKCSVLSQRVFVKLLHKKKTANLPPASIVTRMIPQDQMSAGVAWYGLTSTSGATYGSVPHFLSSSRSRPFILWAQERRGKNRSTQGSVQNRTTAHRIVPTT